MRISFVVAASANNVIGVNGGLPWHLPDDFRYFKLLTLGKPVVMGRRTWDSIGKPLPGRKNIVITRKPDFAAAGATVATSLEHALQVAGDVEEVMVIGGGEIFTAFWPRVERIYLTRVAVSLEGDAFFPPLEDAEWALSISETHVADDRHAYDFVFNIYDRIQ